jgi:hypothetical protein
MSIYLIPGLPALLVILHGYGGQVLAVAVDTDQPRRLILSLARPLLGREERRELARVLH